MMSARKTLKRKVIVPNRERSENTNILYAMNSIHVSLIDAIIDRFGMDVKLTSVSDEVCSFTVPVTLSPEFFGWVLSFGGRMKLISPSKAKMLFRSTCYRIDPPKFNRSYYLESYED